MSKIQQSYVQRLICHVGNALKERDFLEIIWTWNYLDFQFMKKSRKSIAGILKHSLQMSLYGELFPVCLSCFLFCLSWNISCLQTFFRALKFTLRTGDKMNLFRLVGYYIERKNPDRLLRPGPRLEAARWLAAGQLHIEAKWGEVIKEDDGEAKKGEWQWQRWTMGVGDDETGTDGWSFYYRSTNSREMAGHWKEAAGSDEKANEKK